MKRRGFARFGSAFRRFKASLVWIAVFSLLIGLWVAAHDLFGFDHDWAIGVLVLSVDASLNTALISRDQAQRELFQEKLDRLHAEQNVRLTQLTEHLLNIGKATLALVSALMGDHNAT